MRSEIFKPNLLLFFVGLFFLYSFAPKYIGHNQWSRFDLTKAIVEDHRFNINPYVENTVDWSTNKRHRLPDGSFYFYSAKAPGSSFLAVPFYWLGKKMIPIFSLFKGTQANEYFKYPDYYLIRFLDPFVTAIPSVLLSLLLYLYLISRQVKEQRAAWLLFLYSTATIVFPFSTMFWGHLTASFFLFLSFFTISQLVSQKNSMMAMILAGFSFGWAVLTEYPLVLALPGLITLIYWQEKTPSIFIKRFCSFLIGGAIPLLLFFYYHYSAFDSPFRLAYSWQNESFNNNSPTSLGGLFTPPSLHAMWQLTFGQKRGLFLISPFLILSWVGFYNVLSISHSKLKRELIFGLSFSFVIYFMNSSFSVWHGGWSSGPRYLIPIIPYLMIPLGWVKFSIFEVFFAVLSLVNCCAIVAVTVLAPEGPRLLRDQIYPALMSLDHTIAYKYFILQASVIVLGLILMKPKFCSFFQAAKN